MSTTLPLFSLLPNGSSYPPSPTFSDPSFPSPYDGSFPTTIDLSQATSNPLHNYSFPTPPATSSTGTSTYTNRHLSSYPNLIPPNFTHSSFPSTPDHDDPTSSFLDLDLSQPGPSTYHTHASHVHSNARMYDQLSHTASGSGSAFDEVSLQGHGNEFLQQSDDEEDEEGQDGEGEGSAEELVKLEGEDGSAGGLEGDGVIGDVDNEEPLYVNAKQYHRILKRRTARARLEELNRLVRSRKPYLHESRHRHACSRPRGKGGRFLTAEEIEALKKEEATNADIPGGPTYPIPA
ncbi:hypothetical protein IAR55_002812 [Kwoniella newhampshirensis]|uniref:Transcriptional activator HAP2 n=1 Tax=Kwoniella newhampshirensis TaxID=1651941 RepID=A0AAW0YPV6_9TREE